MKKVEKGVVMANRLEENANVTVTRTLLAPSEEQGQAWAKKAWNLLTEMGELARPELEKEFGENLDLYFSEKPSFRREEFFSTGGVQVEIGHPNLPKPIGACVEGRKTPWYCGRDAHFEVDGHQLCRKHFSAHLANLYRGLTLWSDLQGYSDTAKSEKIQQIKKIKKTLLQFPEYASRPLVVEEAWEDKQSVATQCSLTPTYSRVYCPRKGKNARKQKH